ICATRLTDSKRSSRAINESCNVVGIPTSGAPLSSTLLVSSSTNNGTPSVRSTIWLMTSLGKLFPPAICSTRAVRSRRSRRLSVSIVTCGWPVHDGRNSGRKVTISNTGRCHIFVRRRGEGDQCLQLLQSDRGQVVARKPGRSPELVDERE